MLFLILFLIFLDLFYFGALLGLANFCLILFAQRGWRFKLAQTSILLAYVFVAISPRLGLRMSAMLPFFFAPLGCAAHFFWLLRRSQSFGPDWGRRIAKFTAALFVTTAVCTVGWQAVVREYVYDCTDDNFSGFLPPGNWVHEWEDHPVMTVPKIIHGRSMSEPDTILQGWSVAKLWCLWVALFAGCIVTSILAACLPWLPRRPPSSCPSS